MFFLIQLVHMQIYIDCFRLKTNEYFYQQNFHIHIITYNFNQKLYQSKICLAQNRKNLMICLQIYKDPLFEECLD